MYVYIMKRTAEEAEITRQNLLDASLRVFLRKGYPGSRVEDICEEAGVTRGAFYHYFDSRKAVYYAILEERLAPAQELLAEPPENTASPLRRLTAMLTKFLSLMKTDLRFREVNELMVFKTGYVEELQDGMNMKVESMRKMVSMIEDYLRQAAEWQEVKLSCDPHRAALHLYAALNGAVTLLLFDESFFPYHVEAENSSGYGSGEFFSGNFYF